MSDIVGKKKPMPAPCPTFQADESTKSESLDERFARLRKEARRTQAVVIGSSEEIKKDALNTLRSWSKSRKRANKIA